MRGLIDEKVFPVGARGGARRGRNKAYHRGPGTECRDEGGAGRAESRTGSGTGGTRERKSGAGGTQGGRKKRRVSPR